MITSAPGCRSVCDGKPGEVMVELVAAFRVLRAQGRSEAQSLLVARDPKALAGLFSPSSVGNLQSIAEAMVVTGCAECAVNLAYAEAAG